MRGIRIFNPRFLSVRVSYEKILAYRQQASALIYFTSEHKLSLPLSLFWVSPDNMLPIAEVVTCWLDFRLVSNPKVLIIQL